MRVMYFLLLVLVVLTGCDKGQCVCKCKGRHMVEAEGYLHNTESFALCQRACWRNGRGEEGK